VPNVPRNCQLTKNACQFGEREKPFAAAYSAGASIDSAILLGKAQALSFWPISQVTNAAAVNQKYRELEVETNGSAHMTRTSNRLVNNHRLPSL
jgi:hypothetical protein